MRLLMARLFGMAVLTLSIIPTAGATLIVAAGQCDTDPARCIATNGLVTATAYAPKEILPSDPAFLTFKQAFDSWNPGGAGAWTLAIGSLSAEATLTIDLYRAYVDEGCGINCGGAEIDILYFNGGSAPNPIIGCTSIGPDDPQCSSVPDGAAVWSQSILTTAKRDPSLPGNPYLDNAPGTPNASMGPPAYPFQYNGSSFYDMPSRDANASWLADAWISTVDTTARILTVYDGVEWGFTVIPEPGSLTLLATGVIGFSVIRRRRQKVISAAGMV